ncbi:MAG: glycogen synthase GlgA [Pirellulaceae bacterium]
MPLSILLASSEIAPFAKTGGLADVCGALPVAMKRRGHQVAAVMPAYRCVREKGIALEPTGISFQVPIGTKQVEARVSRSCLPGGDVPLYLIEQDAYFDRDALYRENDEDYKDNCERFTFFSRAVLELARRLNHPVDVIHCNDWQTGLIPALLKIEHDGGDSPLARTASLLTIHNMAYQGKFWHWDMILTGLDWKYFNWRQMEFFGELNLLKTGIVFADAVNTVSQRYAEEIQSDPHGCGLEGALRQRSDVLTGIINGVDYSVWNPAIDRHLVKTFDTTNWREGKEACKADIQQQLGLPVSLSVPLIGLVGRLADQKGWDLIADLLPRWLRQEEAQWVILGTGDSEFQKMLEIHAADCPNKIAVRLTFSDELAHKIEAGSDIFLMPSRYEPCGLNQLYSLKYGTVPVVRSTGGLADTIRDASEENLQAGQANGFSFDAYDVFELEEALRRACALYRTDKPRWERLVVTGMSQDWSWDASASHYERLYESMIARKRPTTG